MAPLCRAVRFAIFGVLLVRAQMPEQQVVIHTHPYTPPGTVLHAETNLVEADLTVWDGRGRTIAGLQASDFELFDNGVRQTITAFTELHSDRRPAVPASGPAAVAAQTAAPANASPRPPKYVTFFFDDFHMDSSAMLFVKKAAYTFIEKGVAPSDWMSIVTASGQGDLDFTNDAARFAERLDHLVPHIRPVVPSPCGVSPTDSFIFLHNLDGDISERAIAAAQNCTQCGPHSPPGACRLEAIGIAQQAASSSVEQARAQSLDTIDALGFAAKRLSEANGTRILVLTSSGFLISPGVGPEVQHFTDAALRANIVVHTIGAHGLETLGGGAGSKSLLYQGLYIAPLENIASLTGGHFCHDSNDLAGAMEVAANPEVTYQLAFNPGGRDGKFHTLKIRFREKRADSLQFRPGYFSPAEAKQGQSARAPLDDAVFSLQTLLDVPATVNVTPGAPKDGMVPVSIGITVDANRLQFTTSNGRHFQQIVFLLTLLDANGSFVTGKESIMDLALTDEKLASLRKSGLKAAATLNAPAGKYQARTIVREGTKGALGASTIAVDLGAK